MAEWHLTPEWVLDNWTGEELVLMVEKLAERKHREAEAIRGGSKADKVSDEDLFAKAGGLIKVIRRPKNGD